MTSDEPTLLGVSYPAPPDCMPRLQHLRHMLDSGIDLGNDIVLELLDAVDAAEAARAALADELADLRAIFDNRVAAAVATEREECARVAVSFMRKSGHPDLNNAADIAAAIRARGSTYGAVALSQSAASAAQERPQGGDAGEAPPAPHQDTSAPTTLDAAFAQQPKLRAAVEKTRAEMVQRLREGYYGDAPKLDWTESEWRAWNADGWVWTHIVNGEVLTDAGAGELPWLPGAKSLGPLDGSRGLTGLLHHCRRGTRPAPADPNEACIQCGTKWGDYWK